MASNSSRSISTAPGGKVTPSRRYLSAPQSNSTNSSARLVGAQTALKTLSACGVTSAPMPSPGITAMRALAPPFRMGMPGKVMPPRLLLSAVHRQLLILEAKPSHQWEVGGRSFRVCVATWLRLRFGVNPLRIACGRTPLRVPASCALSRCLQFRIQSPQPRQVNGRDCQRELDGYFFQSAPAEPPHPALLFQNPEDRLGQLLPFSIYRSSRHRP